MKSGLITTILICLLLALPLYQVVAVEIAPRITDREIVERLTRLEEGIKRLDQRFESVNTQFESVNTQFQSVDKQFQSVYRQFKSVDKRFDSLDKRMSDQHTTMIALFMAMISLIIALFGYIAWDRKTMLRPLQEKLDRIEKDLEHDLEIGHKQGSKLTRLLEALHGIAKADPKIATALKNSSLL